MPIEMTYVLKCDVCSATICDGPYDIGFDYLSLSTLPRVNIGDWIIIDYKLVCPKHKIKIFKGYAHGRKK